MNDYVLLGQENKMIKLPRSTWEKHLLHSANESNNRLEFMSGDHHLVRNYIVRELPRKSIPLSVSTIAQKLNFSVERTNTILSELEDHLYFLVRNEIGDVSWAYPVTSEKTPHNLTFDTGEQIYAA